jgi:hypothetical protein
VAHHLLLKEFAHLLLLQEVEEEILMAVDLLPSALESQV